MGKKPFQWNDKDYEKSWDLTVRQLLEIAIEVKERATKADITLRAAVEQKLGRRGIVASGKELDAVVVLIKALLGMAEEERRKTIAATIHEAVIEKMEGNTTFLRITEGELKGMIIEVHLPVPDLEFEE